MSVVNELFEIINMHAMSYHINMCILVLIVMNINFYPE